MTKRKKTSIKESDRLTDRMFMTQMMTSFAMILLCVAMMCTSAFAYFSSSVTSSSNTIKSASYAVDVDAPNETLKNDGYYVLTYPAAQANEEDSQTVQELDEEIVIESQTDESEAIVESMTGVQIETEVFAFTLKKSDASTAKVGFVRIDVYYQKAGETIPSDITTKYTQPIGTYVNSEGNETTIDSRVIGIEVPEGYTVYVKFTSEWGSYSGEGILSSSAISSLEAPDSVNYVSLITTEDYGVEIIDLEEVLVAVTTNTEENAIETYGMNEEMIIEEIRKMLDVTVDGEKYEEYLLEMDELVLPLEEQIEIPVTVVYPGTEIKLRTEVSTVVYLKHTVPVLDVLSDNCAENAFEIFGMDKNQIVEAIGSLLTVTVNDVPVQEYELLIDETVMNNLSNQTEGTYEVPVLVVLGGSEFEPEMKKEMKVYLKYTIPVLGVQTNSSMESAFNVYGMDKDQIVETIRSLLRVTFGNEVIVDYELVVDETVVETLLVSTEGVVETEAKIAYSAQEQSVKVYLKNSAPLPVLDAVSDYHAENAFIGLSEQDVIEQIKTLLKVTLDGETIDEYEVVFPSDWALSEEITELCVTVQVDLGTEVLMKEVVLYAVKAKAEDSESNETGTDSEPLVESENLNESSELDESLTEENVE